MNTNRSGSIELKIEKCRMLLKEVAVLMDNKFYNAAINRLYYSCFYITRALLLTKI